MIAAGWAWLRRWVHSWLRNKTPRPLRTFSPIRETVRELVLAAESLPTSGEYKRHVVYAELLKRYAPKRNKRYLAWLIEDVIREMYDE